MMINIGRSSMVYTLWRVETRQKAGGEEMKRKNIFYDGGCIATFHRVAKESEMKQENRVFTTYFVICMMI